MQDYAPVSRLAKRTVGILTQGTSVPSLMADLTAREHLKLKLQVRQKVTMSAQHW